MSNAIPPEPDAALVLAVLKRIAHDLRTPLSTLTLGLDVLPSVRDDPAEFDDLCQTMRERGTDELRALLEQYMADPASLLRPKPPKPIVGGPAAAPPKLTA